MISDKIEIPQNGTLRTCHVDEDTKRISALILIASQELVQPLVAQLLQKPLYVGS